jgi:hypothetical protein
MSLLRGGGLSLFRGQGLSLFMGRGLALFRGEGCPWKRGSLECFPRFQPWNKRQSRAALVDNQGSKRILGNSIPARMWQLILDGLGLRTLSTARDGCRCGVR